MKIICIVISLMIIQMNTEHPIFIFDFEFHHPESDNSEFVKYITKYNWEKTNRKEVKHLRYINTYVENLPNEIRRFNLIEELELYTQVVRIHACGADGGLFIGYHEEGQLKKLPDWLLKFKKLKKINLDGQINLKIDEVIDFLAQIKSIEEITIEIRSNEILDLEKIVKIKNLRKVKISKNNLREEEKEQISKILTSNKFEFEIKTVNRDFFKK